MKQNLFFLWVPAGVGMLAILWTQKRININTFICIHMMYIIIIMANVNNMRFNNIMRHPTPERGVPPPV